MEDKHVVMFPFMAQGHIFPFLSLALQLEQRSHCKITFVNTPLNIKKLRSSLPPNSSITLVELPFCSTDHGLPPDSENTDSLPYPLIFLLLQASLSLKPSFHHLISHISYSSEQRICIIADMFFGWTVDVANEFGIFHSIFLTGGAYGSALYFSLWLHLPQLETSSDEFSVPDFPEASPIHRSQLANNLNNATGEDPWSLILHRTLLPLWLKTHGILINTVEELDQTGLKYFRRKTLARVPIWPVATSLYSSLTNKARPQRKSGIELNHCIEWLNKQSQGSVLFVSFGSQNSISSWQMMELAIGLEASGKKFIWVVRPPIGFDINAEFRSEWLPEGFEERIEEQNRGVLVRNWAPQLEILSHKSTGAFLSHCGWNSVLESLSHSVPIIGWPLSGEQYYNSKLLEEEVGVCVEVARGTACVVRREEIARVIESVMGRDEKGEEMRKKAGKVKEIINDAIRAEEGFQGSCVKAMDDFINTALTKRKAEIHKIIGGEA